MGSKAKANDADEAVAYLLWQMKSIATKEVENLPNHTVDSFLLDPAPFTSSSPSQKAKEEKLFRLDKRSRAVSVESIDNITEKAPIMLKPVKQSKTNGYLEHHDWSKPDSIKFGRPSRNNPKIIPGSKNSKSKSESFVGQTTKSGIIRGTLQRKFSWKHYPELENFLLDNQDDYFEYSSRNYTAEQRNFNNALTRGLLDLAAKEGYIFEEFTFSQVRDRIRCYFKSYSQSAKKKKRLL